MWCSDFPYASSKTIQGLVKNPIISMFQQALIPRLAQLILQTRFVFVFQVPADIRAPLEQKKPRHSRRGNSGCLQTPRANWGALLKSPKQNCPQLSEGCNYLPVFQGTDFCSTRWSQHRMHTCNFSRWLPVISRASASSVSLVAG